MAWVRCPHLLIDANGPEIYNLHYDEVRGQSTTLSTSGSEDSSEKEILWKQETHPCYEYARLR